MADINENIEVLWGGGNGKKKNKTKGGEILFLLQAFSCNNTNHYFVIFNVITITLYRYPWVIAILVIIVNVVIVVNVVAVTKSPLVSQLNF